MHRTVSFVKEQLSLKRFQVVAVRKNNRLMQSIKSLYESDELVSGADTAKTLVPIWFAAESFDEEVDKNTNTPREVTSLRIDGISI